MHVAMTINLSYHQYCELHIVLGVKLHQWLIKEWILIWVNNKGHE